MLTTQQAADALCVSRRRVQQLIADGTLPAQRFGAVYVIREEDVLAAEGRNRKSGPRHKGTDATRERMERC